MATMERKAVTEAERAALPTACSRCGDVIPEEGWHNGWPLYGRLEIGFPAQAFAALRGRRHIADKSDFEWWATGHPAMTENGAQSVTFEWGNGYRFDSRGRFRMCYECQRSLLAVLGTFFGIAPTLPHDDGPLADSAGRLGASRAVTDGTMDELGAAEAEIARLRAELARERERTRAALQDKLVEAYARGWEDKATGEPFCPRDATEDLLAAAPERQEVGE